MKENNSPVGVGVVSIITVMFLLALAVFSVLTLSSARADLSLTKRGAENIKAYYEADTYAVELLEEFHKGSDDEFSKIIGISEMQGLSIHFVRTEDGSIEIIQWQIVLLQDFSEFPEDILNVWQ